MTSPSGVDHDNPTGADADYARRFGAHLRAIRRQRNWSLHDVEVASGSEFSTAAVGSYERGERSMSVPRLNRLAQLYGVPLDRLLPGPPVAAQVPAEHTMIDLAALERARGSPWDAVRTFVDAVKLRRGDFNGRVITVRATDLWLLASAMGADEATLIRRLQDAGLRVPTPSPGQG